MPVVRILFNDQMQLNASCTYFI